MKQEAEKGRRRSLIESNVFIAIVVVISIVVSATVVFRMERELGSLLDAQKQHVKELEVQIVLLNYRSLKLQVDFLTSLRSQIIMPETGLSPINQ